MITLEILIPFVLIIFGLLLIRYDRNKEFKNKHISWMSRYIFRDNSGVDASVARLHQTILGFLFIFCVGIITLFIIGFFER